MNMVQQMPKSVTVQSQNKNDVNSLGLFYKIKQTYYGASKWTLGQKVNL